MAAIHVTAAFGVLALFAPDTTLAGEGRSPTAFRPLVPMAAVGATPVAGARLVVDATTRALIDDLVERSPAFRRQWERVRSTPRLSVRITSLPPAHAGRLEGWTIVGTTADGLDAHVHLAASATRLVEVLAHEIEHVLEHLDGVQLSRRRPVRDRSVAFGEHGVETRRAKTSGVRVAMEYARALERTRP